MDTALAKSLFKRLGGKISRSLDASGREVWVLRKPQSALIAGKAKRAIALAARSTKFSKTFRMARDLMIKRSSKT